MRETGEVLRRTAVVFLPTLIGIMIAAPLIEALIRHHRVVDQFSAISSRITLLEIVLIPAGFATTLTILRFARLSRRVITRARTASAALLAVLILGIVSIFTQGAPMWWIVLMSILSGAVAALLAFGLEWPTGLPAHG